MYQVEQFQNKRVQNNSIFNITRPLLFAPLRRTFAISGKSVRMLQILPFNLFNFGSLPFSMVVTFKTIIFEKLILCQVG